MILQDLSGSVPRTRSLLANLAGHRCMGGVYPVNGPSEQILVAAAIMTYARIPVDQRSDPRGKGSRMLK